MGLSKCHPITVKPLTVRGSRKYPSMLTNFLPEAHSIHIRDIYQDIGNVPSPFDTSPLFCWSNNFLHAGQHGKLSQNFRVYQVHPWGVLHMSIRCHHYRYSTKEKRKTDGPWGISNQIEIIHLRARSTTGWKYGWEYSYVFPGTIYRYSLPPNF